jgi:hypothetical protein
VLPGYRLLSRSAAFPNVRKLRIFAYATTQQNLGLAYSKAAREGRSAGGLLPATKEALVSGRPVTTPFELSSHASRIYSGSLLRLPAEWAPGLEPYRAAIRTGELLYRAGISRHDKQGN